jgi:hypothetical protein
MSVKPFTLLNLKTLALNLDPYTPNVPKIHNLNPKTSSISNPNPIQSQTPNHAAVPQAGLSEVRGWSRVGARPRVRPYHCL